MNSLPLDQTKIDRRNQHQRWKREARPKTFILYRAKSGAKIRGIDFALSIEDIPDIPEFCPVFKWIKLEYRVGCGQSWGAPSLDRINNDLGYIPGNVRIISNRANRAKSNLTLREIHALLRDARKYNKGK